MRTLLLTSLAAALLLAHPAAAAPGTSDMARIPGGRYTPMYAAGSGSVRVAAFRLDRLPVTRGEYLAFVRAEPRWQRGRVNRAFAEAGYLASWRGPVAAGDADDARRPVTEVSWFAARAYCARRGARLPTADEWEYAARASETRRDASRDPAFARRLLALYRTPRRAPPPVGSGFRNVYGVGDLHSVWEWVEDFNSLLISDDSRGSGGRDHALFCAAAPIGATDPSDYAAYLRLGYRAALEGRTTTSGLGFRCAQDI